ncbi:MAG: right-handed parallel beta-helix repeat-containing protein [Actinomycetota bacterium]
MIHVARALVAGLALATLAACAAEPSAPETTATPSNTATTAGIRERECAEAADGVVAAVERLVAGYAAQGGSGADAGGSGADAGGSGTAAEDADASSTAPTAASADADANPADPGADDLATAVGAAQRALQRLDCDPTTFTDTIEGGLADITPEGPIATAVWRRVSASVLGRVEDEAREHAVESAEDLNIALATAAPGSTILLPARTTTIDTTLVLLDGVHLRGDGRNTTTLESTAPDAAIIVATDGLVELTGLTLSLTGDKPASGLVAGPSASIRLDSVRITGAPGGGDDGAGGAGIHMSAEGDAGSGRGTTLEVTDSAFEDNAWAGIVVGGGHRVSIEGATVSNNGEVGVLFLDSASGSVSNSTVTDNAVGMAATGQSVPTWLSTTITGGEIGVQLDANARVVLGEIRVSGSSSAAVIVGGEAMGAISQLSCVDVPYGIVVADTAAPTISGDDCPIARGG